jgi:hypothetical protein
MDVTQDSEKNVFSCSMQSVYRECNDDPNRKAISRRSLDRLENHSLQNGSKNPFTIASRILASGILSADKKNISNNTKTRVNGILTQLCVTMDELLSDTQVDDAEAETRSQINKLLQVQHTALKDISKSYTALKAKYMESELKDALAVQGVCQRGAAHCHTTTLGMII